MITELRVPAGGAAVRQDGPFVAPRVTRFITVSRSRTDCGQRDRRQHDHALRESAGVIAGRGDAQFKSLQSAREFLQPGLRPGPAQPASRRIAASGLFDLVGRRAFSMDRCSPGRLPERAFSHAGDWRTGSRPALRKIDFPTDCKFGKQGAH